VQGSPEVAGPRVDLATVLSEQLYHIDMALITRHMKRGPTITVTLVNQSMCKSGVFFFKDFEAGHHIILFSRHPDLSQEFSLSFFLGIGRCLCGFIEIIFNEVTVLDLLIFDEQLLLRFWLWFLRGLGPCFWRDRFGALVLR